MEEARESKIGVGASLPPPPPSPPPNTSDREHFMGRVPAAGQDHKTDLKNVSLKARGPSPIHKHVDTTPKRTRVTSTSLMTLSSRTPGGGHSVRDIINRIEKSGNKRRSTDRNASGGSAGSSNLPPTTPVRGGPSRKTSLATTPSLSPSSNTAATASPSPVDLSEKPPEFSLGLLNVKPYFNDGLFGRFTNSHQQKAKENIAIASSALPPPLPPPASSKPPLVAEKPVEQAQRRAAPSSSNRQISHHTTTSALDTDESEPVVPQRPRPKEAVKVATTSEHEQHVREKKTAQEKKLLAKNPESTKPTEPKDGVARPPPIGLGKGEVLKERKSNRTFHIYQQPSSNPSLPLGALRTPHAPSFEVPNKKPVRDDRHGFDRCKPPTSFMGVEGLCDTAVVLADLMSLLDRYHPIPPPGTPSSATGDDGGGGGAKRSALFGFGTLTTSPTIVTFLTPSPSSMTTMVSTTTSPAAAATTTSPPYPAAPTRPPPPTPTECDLFWAKVRDYLWVSDEDTEARARVRLLRREATRREKAEEEDHAKKKEAMELEEHERERERNEEKSLLRVRAKGEHGGGGGGGSQKQKLEDGSCRDIDDGSRRADRLLKPLHPSTRSTIGISLGRSRSRSRSRFPPPPHGGQKKDDDHHQNHHHHHQETKNDYEGGGANSTFGVGFGSFGVFNIDDAGLLHQLAASSSSSSSSSSFPFAAASSRNAASASASASASSRKRSPVRKSALVAPLRPAPPAPPPPPPYPPPPAKGRLPPPLTPTPRRKVSDASSTRAVVMGGGGDAAAADETSERFFLGDSGSGNSSSSSGGRRGKGKAQQRSVARHFGGPPGQGWL